MARGRKLKVKIWRLPSWGVVIEPVGKVTIRRTKSLNMVLKRGSSKVVVLKPVHGRHLFGGFFEEHGIGLEQEANCLMDETTYWDLAENFQ